MSEIAIPAEEYVATSSLKVDGKNPNKLNKKGMERPILNNTAKGQGVYDPFGGSGTTLIAAEQTSRICYMMELMPAYCELTCRRWEKLTGKKRELIKNSKTGETPP